MCGRYITIRRFRTAPVIRWACTAWNENENGNNKYTYLYYIHIQKGYKQHTGKYGIIKHSFFRSFMPSRVLLCVFIILYYIRAPLCT